MSEQQGTESGIYKVLAFTFVGEKTADETLKKIESSGALAGYEILAEAVVEQDKKGKNHIHEPGRGGVGAGLGALGGGLLGLIGGPAGLLVWALGGAALGGVAGHYFGRAIPKEDLEKLGEYLTPDTSALLMLLEDTYSEGVIDSMSNFSANVVTVTVGDELAGELAQYRAGAVTGPGGVTIGGEDVAVVDATGDVDTAGYVAAAPPADTDEGDEEDTEAEG